MYLSIIIPAYNEAQRIKPTLEAIRSYLSNKTFDYEVIVVNDGSTDETSTTIASFRDSMPYLREIRNEHNLGKGYAVRRGMLAATGELRLFTDADNATSIEQLDNLLSFAAKYPIVISSRRLPESRILSRAHGREVLSHLFILLTRLLLYMNVSDTQNGFKLFTARAAEEVFPRQTITGWAFDVEILAIARKLDLPVKEVPVNWIDNGHSRITLSGMIRMGLDLFKITWRTRLFPHHALTARTDTVSLQGLDTEE